MAKPGPEPQKQSSTQPHPPPASPVPPQASQGQQLVYLNWSYFKPEFSGKPDEDAEAHLLCTND